MTPGTPLELTGRLVREGGGFWLVADDGRRLALLLHRMPVDEVEKRVRVTGCWAEPDVVEADGVSLA